MSDLKIYLAAQRQKVNTALEATLVKNDKSPRIVKAMHYSLMAGGKRLRPILCLAAAEAVGGDSENAIPAACALEMLHTYSLIHDDLPAMDDDKLRRGKPTCHVAFDEATAILAGDGLLTLAFEIMAKAASNSADNVRPWLKVIQLIAAGIGYQGMIEGQIRDIASENTKLTQTELEAMHTLKTGALIEASTCAGAILGGGMSEQIEQLKIYARHIGLAFQVTDDILNVEGDPELLGKAVGTDMERHKNTYPALSGLAASKTFSHELIDKALQAIESFSNKAEPLRDIARYIIARNR
ncbi:polyprenyl synthetase family protein [Desulfococcaceae bacterium HSG7]|nr:polyprenyl synthetase family protein [Desulfococcaceae bacterium HSG7]